MRASKAAAERFSRAEFLRFGFLRARPPAAAPPPRAPVRPPGALPEDVFAAACTRCDDCLRACPHGALRKAGPDYGGAAGTPMLVPEEVPCLLCDGLPCVAACAAGALRPPAPGPVRVGIARVDARTCYLAREQPSDYCAVRCPTSPRAVRLPVPGAAPRIDAAVCTGCGFCAEICPAEAIRIEAGLDAG
jgi:ferredoxin-type protein NapF